MVYQVHKKLWFPDPREGEPDGLIAVGGDLSVDRLIFAYTYGVFPYYPYKYQKEPLWYCPMKRFVIFPSEIHVSHSLRQLIRKGTYRCSLNKDFEGVINGCATAHNREEIDGAWLGPDMVRAYIDLHHQGFAPSVEVWEGEKLVGGLYGVNIGASFFGESMFSLVPSASKLALVFLARTMEQVGGRLIDCQFETPHLRSMGGRFISYDDYRKIISH